MDAEDERLLAAEKIAIQEGFSFADIARHIYQCFASSPPLRLYEANERVERREYARVIRVRDEQVLHPSENIDEETWQPFYLMDIGREHRIRRFFDSISGFHKGSLDLTGRFPERYKALMRNFLDIGTFIIEITQTMQQVMEDVVDSDGPHTLMDATTLQSARTVVAPRELLNGFLTRWRVHGSDIEDILHHTVAFTHEFEEYPNPVFQTLKLSDLPPELIGRVMELGGVACARQLRSVCKYLREVSQMHSYRSWHFKLPACTRDWKRFRGIEDDATRSEAFKAFLENEVERRREEYEYVSGREILLHSVQLFTARNEWGLLPSSLVHGLEDFFQSVLTKFTGRVCEVLAYTQNLHRLELTRLDIDMTMLRAIANLPRLCTLTVFDCQINITPGESASTFPMRNLIVSATAGDASQGSTIWDFLSRCASIRALSIDYSTFPDMNAEDTLAALEQCNPFKTVERIFLRQFHAPGLNLFGCVVLHSKANFPLRLTHFKLENIFGISRGDIVELLDALRGSPMENFALDGTAYAEPDLFDLISATFPDLRCLTVIYRDSTRQTKAKPTQWPHATWDYASRFHRFGNLAHFAWNVDLSEVFVTPAVILDFEEDFANTEPCSFSRLDYLATDVHDMAKNFAAFCPTLTQIAITGRYLGCKIARGGNGLVEVAGIDWSKGFEGWNPECWDESWFVS